MSGFPFGADRWASGPVHFWGSDGCVDAHGKVTYTSGIPSYKFRYLKLEILEMVPSKESRYVPPQNAPHYYF